MRHEAGTEEGLRERLHRSAEELGISPEAIARAEQEYLLDRKLRDFTRAKMTAYKAHLISFVLVNLMLHVIWAIVMFGDFYWPGIVLACWGVGLISHYLYIKQKASASDPHFREWLEMGEPVRYEQKSTHSGVTIGVHIPARPQSLPPELPNIRAED